MRSIEFSKLQGLSRTYEMRRDGLFLGCVMPDGHRWTFQVVGRDRSALLYHSRGAAARALDTTAEAFAAARKAVAP